MTDPSTTATDDGATPPTPGERRLARPPSDRYRATEATEAAEPRQVSPGRGLTYAALVLIVAAVAITVLGGVLTLTGGLLVAAAVIGWATGWALHYGAGNSIPTARRAAIAAAMALGAVVAGQIGLWLFAGTEGGVLSLADYLGATFGPLVPIQALIAPVVAWMTAR